MISAAIKQFYDGSKQRIRFEILKKCTLYKCQIIYNIWNITRICKFELSIDNRQDACSIVNL
jgi:hypothetical protein